jgi:hypothetical protein
MNRTLGPRNVGDILRETFTIYRKNIWRFAAIIAVVAIPLSIVISLVFLAIIIFPKPPPPDLGFEEFIMQHLPTLIPASIIILFISIAAEALAQGAMVYCTAEQYFRHPIDNGYAYRFSWKRLPNMLGAVLLIFLTTIAIISIPVGILLASYFHVLPSMNPQLTILVITLGLVSLLALIYIGTVWQFALPAVLLQGCGPISALRASFELVKESWWRVFGIIFVLGLIVFGINLVLAFVPIIGRFVSTIFTPPITFIGSALLYFDLRVRKQGYTLDNMSGELGLPGPTASSVVSPPQ